MIRFLSVRVYLACVAISFSISLTGKLDAQEAPTGTSSGESHADMGHMAGHMHMTTLRPLTTTWTTRQCSG
jgi:hypothetical protein